MSVGPPLHLVLAISFIMVQLSRDVSCTYHDISIDLSLIEIYHTTDTVAVALWCKSNPDGCNTPTDDSDSIP